MHRSIVTFTLIVLMPSGLCYAGDLNIDTLLVFEKGYALGPMGNYEFPLGESLLLFGKVDRINLPADLSDSIEYTYNGDALINTDNGLWDDFDCSCGGYYSHFGEGTFSIYQDETPDADYRNPSTYRDGVLLLEGNFGYLNSRWGECAWCPVLSYGDVEFVTGSLIDLVPVRLNKRSAYIYYDYDQDVGPELSALGIFATTTGGALIYSPSVSSESTTWGRLKRLYK